MEVKHEENNNSESFYIELNGEKPGRMDYTRNGNIITILHTHVDAVLKGKGAGKQLVDSAVRWAKNNNHKIIAQCSFAYSMMEKIPAYHEVWIKK